MALISPTLPTINDPRGDEEVDVRNVLIALLNDHNGNIDNANLKSSANIAWTKLLNGAMLLQQVGSNADGTIRRGKSVTATEQTRTNTSYGPLSGTSGTDATDEVRDVVLPADGLLLVAYQGMWKETVDGAARAALFLNANQVKIADAMQVSPALQEARCGANANVYTPLSTEAAGLVDQQSVLGAAYTGDVTTGQLVGTKDVAGANRFGFAAIFAAAATYDVSVQFKASSGSVTAKNRTLRVWTIGF